MSTVEPFLKSGQDLLRQGRWQEARSRFEEAMTFGESAEVLEGLGEACHWLNDGPGAIGAREAAFRLYNEAGDRRSASRVAVWLAVDYAEFRGEEAVAGAWINRARRMLEDLEPCHELGYLFAVLANLKLMGEKDIPKARELATEARTVAESVQSDDVQMIARAIDGLAHVSEGNVREGMELLDEATLQALGGDCKDITLIGAACCYMISACERVRDYRRAEQWCTHVKEFCKRWRMGSMFASCRTQYSSVLMNCGRWSDAEEELVSASEELSERRPPLVRSATVRLAELRRRQGRFDEARALFGSTKTHLLSLLGQAALALDEGDPETAVAFANRFLRRIPENDRIERVPGLELLIRAYVQNGTLESAKNALAELRSTVNLVSTEPLVAAVRFAEGVVATAEDNPDEALICFEDALDLFERTSMPYESVLSRIELSRVLQRTGQDARSLNEANTALSHAENIGAEFLARSAWGQISSESYQRIRPEGNESKSLSGREKEVLLLIAQGKDNTTIADELFLSVRTVERHISNAYQKLGITGKSARVAAAAYAMKNLSHT